MLLRLAVLATSLALSADSAGRAQLLPAGEFAARDGRPGPGKTWKLTDAQGEALAAAVNQVAAQTPIVIDYEHQTLTATEKGHKAPAAGWIKRVEWLTGKGLFADVEWTDAAKAHIDAKEYRFISPVITYDAGGKVTGLQLAALTNHPGLLGMEPAMAAALTAFSGTPPTAQESTVTLLAALIAGLGLKAEATDADVIAAVATLKAQVAAVPAVPTSLAASLKLPDGADMTAACSAVAALVATETSATATIAALQGEIATLRAKGAGDEVAAAVDKALADGKLLPAQKDWALSLGRKDMTALKSFIDTAPVLAPGSKQTQGDPDPQNTTALTAQQTQVFAAFGIKPEDAKKHLDAQKAKA